MAIILHYPLTISSDLKSRLLEIKAINKNI